MAVGAIRGGSLLSGLASMDVARSFHSSSHSIFLTPQPAIRPLASNNGDRLPRKSANSSSVRKAIGERDIVSHKNFFGKQRVERPFSYEHNDNQEDLGRSQSTAFQSSVMQKKDRKGFGNELKEQQEADVGVDLLNKEDLHTEQQHKSSQLKKRVLFGFIIGITVGGVVLAGGWIYTVAIAVSALTAAREYFGLVRSRGIASGMTPPPRYVSRVCSVICALMPIGTLYFGHIDIYVTSAAFIVGISLLLQRENPRFSQLSSTMFGLFYCGYLPCFWVKLRCGLSAPASSAEIGRLWPFLLGGQTHWTVGLVATLASISSIIAADTFAFLGGKAIGRTPLTNISPKKTWEGALVGLAGCVGTSVALSKVFSWPKSLLSAVALGFLTFFGSLFGDLIESMIKRDAGVKDSGTLIPGHGGILDRVDSYMFTGALAYSFVKTFLPLYGL